MGFSTVGASVILITGLLFFGSVVANSMFEAQRETTAAFDANRDRAELKTNTEVSLADGNHNAGSIHLNLTNDGRSVLDASLLHLIVDGTWKTDQITSTTIGGTSTDVWAPGETLYLRATQATAPSRTLIVLETGQTVVWT